MQMLIALEPFGMFLIKLCISSYVNIVLSLALYYIYYNLMSKFNIGLKSFLCQGFSEPEFDGNFAYRLKKIVGYDKFISAVF